MFAKRLTCRLWLRAGLAATLILPSLAVSVASCGEAFATMDEVKSVACWERLSRIWSGLDRYWDVHRRYPPAGQPELGVSWRVAIGADWTDAIASQYRQDEPWSSAHNRMLIRNNRAELMACPAAPEAVRQYMTSYFAVTGPGTVWSEARHLKDPAKDAPDKILLVEVPESKVSWMEPKDLSVEDVVALFKAKPGLKGTRHPHGLHYLTAGGDVKHFGDLESVEALLKVLKLEPKEANTAGKSVKKEGDR